MPPKRKDLLTQVREQAERTLAMLTAEIRRREADLENLLEQARLWRDAITSSFSLGPRTKKAASRKAPAKKKAAVGKAPAKKKRAARGTRGSGKASTKKRAKKATPAAARRAKASAKKSRTRKVGARRASRTG